MTKDKGRGVFATDDISRNEILIVEKPIVRIFEERNFIGRAIPEIQ